MRVCISCGDRFSSDGWQCPVCHFAPVEIDGFPAFAPELAEKSDGFHASLFSELAPLEAMNFWFRSRNQLIIWAISKYFPELTSFLEIGCGTGYVLSSIEHEFPDIKLCGSEIFSSGLGYAKKRIHACELYQMDARKIPFEEEFDVIGAFDVLEHIQEDERVLSEMYRAVRPGGGIIMTVPQHDFLWSRSDEYACHVRRYSSGDLVHKLHNAGFVIKKKTSFVFLLLPLMMASRLRQSLPVAEYDPLDELRIGGMTNRLLGYAMSIERAGIQAGIRFPVGGSLLMVAYREA
jgi:SAM-dependent methyltransferase